MPDPTPTYAPCDTSVRSYQRLVARRAERFWRVRCTCGFFVADLSSEEAAEDTFRWHLGQPSLLGTTGISWREPDRA